jgi:hypothetical protein
MNALILAILILTTPAAAGEGLYSEPGHDGLLAGRPELFIHEAPTPFAVEVVLCRPV